MDRAVRSRYDWSTTAPSRAVIDAVASAEDTTPIDLAREMGTTLYDYVDPEALDAIVGDCENDSVRITFDVDHHRITIESSGRLVVDSGDP